MVGHEGAHGGWAHEEPADEEQEGQDCEHQAARAGAEEPEVFEARVKFLFICSRPHNQPHAHAKSHNGGTNAQD